MGEKTGISWTDSSWNPWIGCTKVSAGCKLCYAETQNRRFNWNPAGWGPGAARKLTSDSNWKDPMKWAKKAIEDGVLRRVFAGSLCDPLDPEVSDAWRKRYFNLVDEVGEYCRYFRTVPGSGLEFMILTKRIHGAWKLLPGEWIDNPPEYVRLGVTAEDQKNADHRIPELLLTWHGKNFISFEPLLSRIRARETWIYPGLYQTSIQWAIIGGESGAGCRQMDLEWARDLKMQFAGIPVFIKQLGGYPDKRHNPEEWPDDLRIQQFPSN